MQGLRNLSSSTYLHRCHRMGGRGVVSLSSHPWEWEAAIRTALDSLLFRASQTPRKYHNRGGVREHLA